MGTGFTIDTPIKVAKFGISSVISLVDDHLIEQMRRRYCALHGETFEPIADSEKDHRALRITAYLNLLDLIVGRQIGEMKWQSFDGVSDLSLYFDRMHDQSDLKRAYQEMLLMDEGANKVVRSDYLRTCVVAGSIDVNIMTKADRENSFKGEKLPREFSDALAALRGYANSSLRSSVIFSAGLNPYLYSYVAEFDDFYAGIGESPRKKVVLKVSDFRSASIQARTLAKKGVWVSEFRVESGLNCGGHAFPTAGHLLGPILDEFKHKKRELIDQLFPIYQSALLKGNRIAPSEPYPVLVTAQGGVGTAEEHDFLLEHYDVHSVGWGTPFLLVPEVTAVDQSTLDALLAKDKDVYLSDSSPLGVPYYNLRNSASEEKRSSRIDARKPGSPCLNKHLALNTEFGEPLCVASREYQRKKLKEIQKLDLSASDFAAKTAPILEKSCICRNLGDGALLKYGITVKKTELTPAICPGPNIAYFSRVCSLSEMVGHIYGRISVFNPRESRPHMFINELRIYADYFIERLRRASPSPANKEIHYFMEFKQNLLSGIAYYAELLRTMRMASTISSDNFASALTSLSKQLELIRVPEPTPDAVLEANVMLSVSNRFQ